jgi:uncharacterized protein involved in exopolysaccharide biosynthesis
MSGEMEKIRKKLDELEKNRERGREKHREAGSTDQGTRREIEEKALIKARISLIGCDRYSLLLLSTIFVS